MVYSHLQIRGQKSKPSPPSPESREKEKIPERRSVKRGPPRRYDVVITHRLDVLNVHSRGEESLPSKRPYDREGRGDRDLREAPSPLNATSPAITPVPTPKEEEGERYRSNIFYFIQSFPYCNEK